MSSGSPNCSGLTKMLTATTSHSARARSISETCPACSAPMVGTRPTVAPRRPGRIEAGPAAGRRPLHVDRHGGRSPGSYTVAGTETCAGVPIGGQLRGEGGAGLVAGALGLAQGVEMPAERRPVAPAGRPGEGGLRPQGGHVVDGGPRQRQEGLEVEADGDGDPLHLAEQGHDVVRRDAGGGVVGGPVLVGHVDRAAAEGGRDLVGDVVAGHRERRRRAQPGGADFAVGQRDERVHRSAARWAPSASSPSEPERWTTVVVTTGTTAAATSAMASSGVAMHEDVDAARPCPTGRRPGAGTRRIPSRAPRARRRGTCRPGLGR